MNRSSVRPQVGSTADDFWIANQFSTPPMSNPNGLLSQKVCHYLDQGGTLNSIVEGCTWNGLL